MVKTKIIATLGPASATPTVLRKMFANGLDIVRLNFSHGTHKNHVQLIQMVRSLDHKMRRAIKIMQDLEGYRIRTGKVAAPIELKKHHEFYLTQENVLGSEDEVSFDYKGPLKNIKKGMHIYIADGKIVLEVIGVEKKRLKVRSLVHDILKDRKGINIPGMKLNFKGLTEKDRRDVKIAIEYKLDYVAQSFVRNANDLKLLKAIVKPKHPACKIVAKIENQEALRNLDEIIDEADVIMVARGDLGVCVPIYEVPVLQKEIIKHTRLKNKPVIVATQMLESMTESPVPTRAEVSDVANAVLDGATCVMLSGETAAGKYPSETISMMNKVLKTTEAYKEKLKDLLIP